MVPSLELESASASEILAWATAEFGDDLAVATSFQKEGMVIIDLASRVAARPVRVFTIDTGRLPDETHQMIETVWERYGVRVETVLPDASEVEAMVSANGPNLFYRDVVLRSLCCHIRKVRPLERKLATLRAWVAGLRRDQSATRADIAKVETVAGTTKISPLADWTAAQVDEYVRRHKVPLHPLYERGYLSVGCAPCTRAVHAGEAERSGRWWWEQDQPKECGIHFSPQGKAERRFDILVNEVLSAKHA